MLPSGIAPARSGSPNASTSSMLQPARRSASRIGGLSRAASLQPSTLQATTPPTVPSTSTTVNGIAQRQWRHHQPADRC
ncbi:hypothetical protein G6F55_014507 [Rhizopus delemar]|nr:hypothetical protein G6F55_014507 [Rhizopus delemar]